MILIKKSAEYNGDMDYPHFLLSHSKTKDMNQRRMHMLYNSFIYKKQVRSTFKISMKQAV